MTPRDVVHGSAKRASTGQTVRATALATDIDMHTLISRMMGPRLEKHVDEQVVAGSRIIEINGERVSSCHPSALAHSSGQLRVKVFPKSSLDKLAASTSASIQNNAAGGQARKKG